MEYQTENEEGNLLLENHREQQKDIYQRLLQEHHFKIELFDLYPEIKEESTDLPTNLEVIILRAILYLVILAINTVLPEKTL